VTKESQAPLAVFLGLTFGLSAVFWGLIVAAGTLREGEFGTSLAAATAAR